MYNLTVEGAHTFTVGDGDWVVHNQNNPNGNQWIDGPWQNSPSNKPPDPLEITVVNQIQASFPQLQMLTNRSYWRPNINTNTGLVGSVNVTEVDIELPNAIIEVKSGGSINLGNQFTQLRNTNVLGSKQLIYYAPNLTTGTLGNQQQTILDEGGADIAYNMADLLSKIKACH